MRRRWWRPSVRGSPMSLKRATRRPPADAGGAQPDQHDPGPHGRTVPEVVLRQTRLEVLAGVGDRVDGPARLGALLAGDERADEHDPLALLAGDAGPVVRVGGVG